MNILAVVNDTMNTAAVWYENSVLMSLIGVVIGAVIGFAGNIVQSKIAAKNNIAVIKAQTAEETKQHYYMEKEKLYSELISFVPQFSYSVVPGTRRLNLSKEQKIQLNTFKARLSIFATKEIYDEFYDLIISMTEENDDKKMIARMDAYTETLLNDLKESKPGYVATKSKKTS